MHIFQAYNNKKGHFSVNGYIKLSLVNQVNTQHNLESVYLTHTIDITIKKWWGVTQIDINWK